MDSLPAPISEDEDLSLLAEGVEPTAWQLKELKPIHRQMCSLMAQGLKNVEIATILNLTPEYISMLSRQPLVKEHINRMAAAVSARFEAMTELTADTIADGMLHGNMKEKLGAARLQLEVTKRVGAGSTQVHIQVDASERLNSLADRLTGLLSQKRQGVVLDGHCETVQEG